MKIERHVGLARKMARREARCRRAYDLLPDMEQAAVLGLYRALETWEPAKGAFSTYAAHWCRYYAQQEWLRLVGRVRTVDVDGVALSHDPWKVDDRVALLQEALLILSPRARRDVVRHHAFGVTCTEIAEEEGTSRAAVSKRIRKSLPRLRERIGT